MKQSRLLCFTSVLFIGLNHTAFADIAFWERLRPPQAKFLLQVGGFNATQGKSQNVAITGLIGDRFSVTKQNDQNVLLGLGYFIPGFERNPYHVLFGLNAFYFAPTTVKGTIYQEHMFNNLSYQYKTTSYPIYLAAKGLIDTHNDRYTITVDAGLGPNILSTSQFSESSLDGITLPDNAFKGNTSAVFSATVGVGVQFNKVFGQKPLECGYRFFYLGQNNFNKQTNQISNLSTGNIYVNALMCSVLI
jgi:hypothetical protein